MPPDYSKQPNLNELGLTAPGREAIDEILKLGMILDVDHMSQKAFDETLNLATKRGQPVVAGHAGLRALQFRKSETTADSKVMYEGNKGDGGLARLSNTGSLIGVITNIGDTKTSPATSVLSTCSGSSRSWLQGYAHAVSRVGRVALGTDANGFAGQPGPRFGAHACLRRNKGLNLDEADPPRHAGFATAGAAIRADSAAQSGGVAYSSKLTTHVWQRYVVRDKDTMPLDADEMAALEAVAIRRMGLTADQYRRKQKPYFIDGRHDERVLQFLRGFEARAVERDFFGNHYVTERNAAYLALNPKLPYPAGNVTPPRTRELRAKVAFVLQRFNQLESGSNTQAPLLRSALGNREWDLNFDGLAHYGLLPDFLQDVANQLRTATRGPRDLSDLFRSAEDYVALWERVEAGAGR